MITVKDIFDAWPDDTIGLDFTITAETTLADIEQRLANDWMIDTLFLFVIRELCNPRDEMLSYEPLGRMENAMKDLQAVHTMLEHHAHCLAEDDDEDNAETVAADQRPGEPGGGSSEGG